jgi:ABC-type cobalt transport system substrate-binding protein
MKKLVKVLLVMFMIMGVINLIPHQTVQAEFCGYDGEGNRIEYDVCP